MLTPTQIEQIEEVVDTKLEPLDARIDNITTAVEELSAQQKDAQAKRKTIDDKLDILTHYIRQHIDMYLATQRNPASIVEHATMSDAVIIVTKAFSNNIKWIALTLALIGLLLGVVGLDDIEKFFTTKGV